MADSDARQRQKVTAEREAHRDATNNAIQQLRLLLEGADEPSTVDLDARMHTAEHFAALVRATDTQIMDIIVETDEDMGPEITAVSQFDQNVVAVLRLAEAKLSQLRRDADNDARSVAASSDTRSVADSYHSVQGAVLTAQAKLPKLELKSFAGDPIEWQSFWDSFTAKVDLNPSIADIDKLHYLIKLLEGEAEEAIKGYRPTADNYPVIVAVLKEHFGNPETAKFKHFEALFALPSAESEPQRLKEIYKECEKHIRCLVALGLPEDTFGQVFVPLILSKLPRQTRLLLHRSNGRQDWTLANLRDLMKNEIFARDLSDRFSKGFSNPPKSKPPDTNGGKSKLDGAAARSHPPKGRPWATHGSMVVHSKSRTACCAFCEGSHFSDACTKYTSVNARKAVLKNRCYRCLSSTHRVAECKSKGSCYFCNATDHHSSLCYKQSAGEYSGGAQKPPNSSFSSGAKSKGGPETSLSVDSVSTPGPQAVLKMASVRIPEHDMSLRLYFDDGSSSTYITTAKARRLRLPLKEYQYASVGRFGTNKRQSKRFRTAELTIPLRDGSSFPMKVYVVDTITTTVQKLPLNPRDFPSLSHLPLADTLSNAAEMVDIDVLIGGDYLHRLFTGERISVDDNLFLYGSRLGYVAAGTVDAKPSAGYHQSVVVMLAPSMDLNRDSSNLERLWLLENIGVTDDPHVSDDQMAQSTFDKTLNKVKGRFEVGLPFREDTVDLPDNFGLAKGRLKSLQKSRLQPDRDTMEQYDKIICDQIKAGIVEVVPDDATGASRVHYLPHHCVSKPGSATTKLRVVFDASAKARKADQSLNDALHRGPVAITDLCGFLLRSRIPEIVLISDIEKAFHQIGIRREDRDCLRFLWLKRPWLPPSPENLKHLRFCRVPFGMVCSPFLLDATIRHHLEQKGSPTALDIRKNIYVDNVLACQHDVSGALAYYQEAKQSFSDISMNIREWHSNSEEFLARIAADDRGSSASPKVLGIPWDTKSDRYQCVGPTTQASNCKTKRQFLSFLSSIFDPCGWISPIIVVAKLILQELWKANSAWDKVVPQEVVDKFREFVAGIKGLDKLTIPRQVNAYIASPDATHELHCFVDASAKAYAAVMYCRSISPGGKTSTGLLFAKVRLAPIKAMSIPRLELMAALIGVRIMNFVVTQLESRLTFANQYLWSDSKCVLFWLQSTKNLKVFVRNRLAEIKNKAANVEFRYVPTTYNPADIPSRGITVAELKDNSLWWHGPNFLVLPRSMWPENIPEATEPKAAADEVVSLPMQVAVAHKRVIDRGVGEIVDPARFSSWKKLLRVTAFVFLAISKFRSRRAKSSAGADPRPPDLSTHLRKAQTALLKSAQAEIDASSPDYRSFRIFKDEDGLLRCSTRMGNSALPEQAQNPILLPKNNQVTWLIIFAFHEQMAHAGVRQTLIHLRSQYWVIHGKSQVQMILKRCPACRKSSGGPYKTPEFAPLPSFRVTPSLPFDKLGIDYLGPLLVKVEDSPVPRKVWVSLFTCCVTRAVHLELVKDLSAESFLLCFRRFVALFTKPSLIVSDNATHFKATDAAFKKAAVQWSTGEGIEWKYIVEMAPWMGGFYERLVGCVKSALRKTLGSKRLSADQLSTLLYEIAAIVNSRPLIPGGDQAQEPGDLALTPAHFLSRFGRPGFQGLHDNLGSWETTPKPTSQTLLESWQRGQQILDEFWSSWHKEYLTALREQSKIEFRQRNCDASEPAVGAVVQVKDGGPRALWKMGIVQDVRVSADGKSRAANIRTSNGKLITRPLKLLYPLEQSVIDATSAPLAGEGTRSSDNASATPLSRAGRPGSHQSSSGNPSVSAGARPRRQAALHARDRNVAGLLSIESDDE